MEDKGGESGGTGVYKYIFYYASVRRASTIPV